MDPNEVLTRIRERVAHLRANLGPDVGPLPLADDIEALDHWLARGGFPPQSWQAPWGGRGEHAHLLRLDPAPKMDTPDLVRAVCSCGDYSSSNDTPHGATRSWVSHYLARTRGVGR